MIVGVVKVLFVDVSVVSSNIIVPVLSGKVWVRSAVGSVKVIVVSKLSSVAPSKAITRPGNINESCLISGSSELIATTASTKSVDEAIKPLASKIFWISPISSAVPLNSNRNLFNVSPTATDLSAIFYLY